MNINRLFTFRNFRMTPANILAVRAAQGVTDGSTFKLDPLIIYGPSSSGKSHLLHAIANRAEEKNPNAGVLMIRANALFLASYEAEASGDKSLLKEIYECADYFLIDDLNKIPETDNINEALSLLKYIVKNGGRVVITSKYMPGEIPGINKEFKRFLCSGLCVDIKRIDEQ